MIAPVLLLAPFVVLLLMAAIWDIASFTIPNFLQLALVAAFGVFVFAVAMPLPVLGWHLIAGLAGLFFGFTLFALGLIGGGDAKLFAAISLWLGFDDMAAYLLAAVVLGGGLSLALIFFRKCPLPEALSRRNWLARLHDPRQGVPYGVALAAGVFLILPQTDIFRLAAA